MKRLLRIKLLIKLIRYSQGCVGSSIPLPEKCTYSEFFLFVFPRTRTEYEGILIISPYSVRMRKNTDPENSECGHFSRSVPHHKKEVLEKVFKILFRFRFLFFLSFTQYQVASHCHREKLSKFWHLSYTQSKIFFFYQ